MNKVERAKRILSLDREIATLRNALESDEDLDAMLKDYRSYLDQSAIKQCEQIVLGHLQSKLAAKVAELESL